nr:MAG TPA: hypothetical protein [Caudoviricetes sp.]
MRKTSAFTGENPHISIDKARHFVIAKAFYLLHLLLLAIS